MERQVSAIVKSCHFHISNIGRIRSFITTTACKTLVNSLVTSRLDHGSILLNGINKTTLNRLQKVQNTAARLITRTRNHEHITPILADLHWLPVQYKPQYKILIYVYCALNSIGPAYIHELVNLHVPNRSLRSSSLHNYLPFQKCGRRCTAKDNLIGQRHLFGTISRTV
ncbi:unnamed protein product [Mytilus coruscus]|uniref:Uncharacterized protein n=1 Tax=Mytilus coruscus TaxID=42192 RepID=A0A6J8B271_MYTCO|nr:unnamed protein product [Mytilus coruscus]